MDILRPDLFIHKLDAPLDPETELADGSGRMETITGSVYSGTFRRGRMTEGRFEWPDGARFEGTVGGVRDGDALTGDGVFEWTTGTTYTGKIRSGYRHGQGTLHGVSGIECTGEWKDGMLHGKAIVNLVRPEGTHTYEGIVVENRRHGHGRMHYASGATYEGEWHNDRRCGMGTMTWPLQHQSYVGEWKDDVPHGQGEYTWSFRSKGAFPHRFPFTNVYKGTFLNGKRDGFGEFRYATGAWYRGTFANNAKHGRGMYRFENGRVVEAVFEMDRMVEEVKEASDILYWMRLRPYADDDDTAVKMLRELNPVLLRFTVPLKQLYDAIAVECGGSAKTPLVTVGHVFALLKQAGTFTVVKHATYCDAIAPNYTGDTFESQRADRPYASDSHLTFPQFAEALVHAALLHGGSEEGTVYGKVERFLKNVLGAVNVPEINKLMNPEHDRLVAKFHEKCNPTSQKMSLRAVLLWLSDTGAFNELTSEITVTQFLDTVRVEYPSACTDDSFNLELEITEYDFVQIVTGCVLTSHLLQ